MDSTKPMKSRVKKAILSFFGFCFIFGHSYKMTKAEITATLKKAPHLTAPSPLSQVIPPVYLYSPVCEYGPQR